MERGTLVVGVKADYKPWGYRDTDGAIIGMEPDMAKIVAEALEERPRPQMVLVCTDGWTPWPKEDCGVPIIACLSNRVESLPDAYKPPAWITSLELKGTES